MNGSIQDKPTNQDKGIDQLLIKTDFSRDSRIRQSLRRKLLNESVIGKKVFLMKTNILQQRGTQLTATIVAIMLIVLLVTPQGVSFAQGVVHILQTWMLGDATTAVRVEGDFVAVPDENGKTIIQAVPDNVPEKIPEEGEPALAENISLEAAQELVDFQILQPGFIPEGYESQGVNVANAESVQMDYLIPYEIGLIGLTQTVAGGINGNAQVSFSNDIEPAEVLVNGTQGLWIANIGDFGLLVWEAGGVNYQLQLLGNLADLETALQIAESLY